MRPMSDRLIDPHRRNVLQPAGRAAVLHAGLAATLALSCASASNGGSSDAASGAGRAASLSGASSLGGASLGGGGTAKGGTAQNGGNRAIGGATASGGSSNTSGGSSNARGGNSNTSGGASSTALPTSGGKNGTSGSRSAGGAATTGGATTTGGAATTGGVATTGGGKASAGAAVAAGGIAGTGGSKAIGGAAGTGGGATAGAPAAGSTGTGPCDIYAAANTPCVAAHSTVRALYGAYNGPLYQLRRASDKTVKDVPVLASGGFVDVSVQNTFCQGTTCTISILYDQTSNKNDLVKSPKAHWLANGGVEADAAQGQITVGGHIAHGIYVTSGSNVAYRNNATKGVAKNSEAEAMYMVVDGKRFSSVCCFDYGNAETTGNDDGNGTMEAIYFGADTTWGGKGEGSGPWVAADLENGMFKSNQGGWQTTSTSPNDKSIIASYVTAMLKGPAANTFAIKGGNAQSGTLTTMWNGARPSGAGYYPKKLQGAIILGTGGDGSNYGTGTFFEGAMTSGDPPDSVDDAIQANIVAAGYGR
jgi:hypothetical protein